MTESCERGAFVLVLEDEGSVAKTISRVIVRAGAGTPRVASTYSAGVEFVRSFQQESAFRRLCGAILDVTVPGGCGLDLIPHAREIAKDLPILVLTGDMSPAIANAAQQFGVEFAYKLEEAAAIRSFLLRIAARDREPRALVALAVEKGLTAAETEIVALWLRGLRHKEIEARLQITEGTRKSHIHNLLGRCDLPSLDAVCDRVRRGGGTFRRQWLRRQRSTRLDSARDSFV